MISAKQMTIPRAISVPAIPPMYAMIQYFVKETACFNAYYELKKREGIMPPMVLIIILSLI